MAKAQTVYSLPDSLTVARTFVFLIILALAVANLIFNPTFQSDRMSLTLLGVSFVGLGAQFFQLQFQIENRNLIFLINLLNSVLLCFLFWGLQSAQSLFLLLLLVNVLLYGLEAGVRPATELALATSGLYSFVIILSPSFSHFQDLLSLGLFNVAAFVVAALSGQYSEKLSATETAYRKSKNLLEDLSTRHRVLVEELPLGLVVWGAKGQMIERNHYFLKHFVNACNWREFFKSDIKPHLLDQTSQFFYQFEKRLDSMDFVFRNALIQSGDDSYILTLIENVTEQRRLESDLKQKEKMAAIGTLAAGIAHEIRNPLAGMSGSIELLSGNQSSDEDRKLFKIILKEIDRLNNLITEFLEFSKPEQRPQERVSITSILDDVLTFVSQGSDKPANLKVLRTFDSVPKVLGSADKLRQAFINIIVNSVQAMSKSEEPVLDVKVHHDLSRKSVVVFIRDNGCGMSESAKQKIFEPFHTTKAKGTGLGLAITHKILDSHQAKVFVKSEVGQGTEFELIFPCP